MRGIYGVFDPSSRLDDTLRAWSCRARTCDQKGAGLLDELVGMFRWGVLSRRCREVQAD